MNKDEITKLTQLLPGRDAKAGLKALKDRRYEDLKEIVDINIRKLEKIEDATGEIEVCLASLYKLSEGLNDYIFVFEDNEEI